MTFKIGDKVLIVQRGIPDSPGFANSWLPRMDLYINNGVVYTIRVIRSSGISLAGLPFCWDPKSLVVEKSYKEERVITKCKKLWNKSKYVKKNPKYAY